MKNKLCFVLLIFLFIILIQPNDTNAKQNKIENKLLLDTMITLLDPYISEAVEQYYGYHKSYGLYDAKILGISREEDGGFSFNVKVQVNTFEEAHNPPYGKETIILGVEVGKVKVIKFIHEGDEEERKIANFYNEAITDIKETFKINLNTFKKIKYEQLLYKSEKQKEYKSLSDIVTNILVNELNPEIKPPYKNIIEPVTFIKNNQGYILFKKADGTNIVFQVSRLNGKWVVVKEESRQGKKMKNDLLWYM
ncbi:DUF3888 domain-containing protein [Oceanobacillus profundus]|uniref:DUF3888 domain-containing protein n=1 Tax=Oceanobacillus profundus TaxID=372463 RepID=UPI00203FCE1F|nr:DUF3888 domain-containing protein [Oceanobacillus profundus]MCM3399349.1 DUF3888 domain-containing protein [Oceanobacillus profundus]